MGLELQATDREHQLYPARVSGFSISINNSEE